jgi:hypothetical protein
MMEKRIGNSSPSPRFSRVGEREKCGEGLELTSQMVFGLVFLQSFAWFVRRNLFNFCSLRQGGSGPFTNGV